MVKVDFVVLLEQYSAVTFSTVPCSNLTILHTSTLGFNKVVVILLYLPTAQNESLKTQ